MEGLIFTEVAKVFIMMFLVMYFSAGALDEDASIFKDDQPSNDKYNVIERYLKPRRCRVYINVIRFLIDWRKQLGCHI